MKGYFTAGPFIVMVTIVVTTSLFGCAEIRKLTYPKDFTYLEKKEVDALMQQMSEGLMRLDKLLAEPVTSDSARQQSIVGELDALESIANRLSGGHKQTNRPVIEEHIEDFIGDIEDARMFASASPPNYSNAGELTDSCLECHKFR